MTQVLLATDGAVLSCYETVSLLFVPGSIHEPYLSSGRLLYGVLPAVLGLASLVCVVWASLRKGDT
jgi:hypothetical protein